MDELVVVALVASAGASMILALVRLLLGPTQADRVVALDIVFSCNVALTAAAAVAADTPLYLDVGLGLSLVGFVGTILWARLLEKSPRDPQPEGEGEGEVR